MESFRDGQFTASFETKFINWFTEPNNSQINPFSKEKLKYSFNN